MTDQICIRCKRVMDYSDSLSICPSCQAREDEIVAREDRVNFMLTVNAAWKASGLRPSANEMDDVIDDEPSVLIGEPAQEIPCETCGKLFWSLDSDHTECAACDGAGEPLVVTPSTPQGRVIDHLFIDEASQPDDATLTRVLLAYTPKLPVTSSEPLSPETAGLVELAEHVADGLETGAIMLLTEAEAAFMHNVCLFDGLLVYPHQRAEIIMAAKLEQGGLVTVQRAGGYVIVSAVRPTEGEE